MVGDPSSEVGKGMMAGLSAFGIWALVPLYFKAIAAVPPWEVLAHRVVWSLLIVGAMLVGLGGLRGVWRALSQPVLRWRLLASALLVSSNWLLFIWAIANNRVLECSLGYYINPLVNVVLGVLFLGERLGVVRWMAVGIAAVGVAVQVVALGNLPWIALVLSLTFGAYGLIRKQTPVGPLDGLLVETLFLLPVAGIYLLYLAGEGTGTFVSGGWSVSWLLVLSGVVTASPLLLFAYAAHRLRLSTVGLMQYIAPTGHFFLAVWVFDEPFGPAHLITFSCIWVALAVYTGYSYRELRRLAR